MPLLDLKKLETQLLMLQIVNQTGKNSNACTERDTHRILQEPMFCQTLLTKLRERAEQMTQNWDSWRALAIFVLIARRIVNLSSDAQIQGDGLKLLTDIRTICIALLCRLRDRARAVKDDEQRKDLQSRSTEIALLCLNTLDIEETYWPKVLESAAVVKILL